MRQAELFSSGKKGKGCAFCDVIKGEADGSFVALNNKISQSVPHVHVHVVPRWKKDGLFSRYFVWVRRPYRDEAEMGEVQGKIKAAVEGLKKAAK